MIKPGVKIAGLKPEMQIALDYAEEVYETFNHTLIITEALAETGHVKNSRHYTGHAIDIRIWNLGADLHRIFGRLLKGLEPMGFDIVLENDHIHIEYDPKEAYQCS